jgi:hypothetical protein
MLSKYTYKPPPKRWVSICLCLVILYFNLPTRIAIPAQCHRRSSASLYFVTIITHPLKIAIFKNLTNYRICIKIPHHYKTVNLKTLPKTVRNCILMPHHYKQFAMEAVHLMPLHMHPAQRIDRMHCQYWLLNPMLTPGGGVDYALQQSDKQPQGRTAWHGLIGPLMTTISAGVFLDQESAPQIGSSPCIHLFCHHCRWMRISGMVHCEFFALLCGMIVRKISKFDISPRCSMLGRQQGGSFLFHPPSSNE